MHFFSLKVNFKQILNCANILWPQKINVLDLDLYLWINIFWPSGFYPYLGTLPTNQMDLDP